MRSLAAFLANLILACALVAPASAYSGTHTAAAATSRAATPSDAEIEATIRTKLAKSKIGKDGFKFHVSHGVVTWDGTTAVMQHKGSATRMAHAAGAVKVVNNIQVTGGAKPFTAMKKAAVVQ